MTREEMIKALLAEVDNWDIEDLKWFAKTLKSIVTKGLLAVTTW